MDDRLQRLAPMRPGLATSATEDNSSRTAAQVFEAEPCVLAGYLFGSMATGRAGPCSDIDFAVLLRRAGMGEGADELLILDRLARQLSVALGISERAIDVVGLNDKGTVFRYGVVRTGRLVYQRDRKARILFEWGVVRRYLDFRPTLEIFDRASRRKGRPA